MSKTRKPAAEGWFTLDAEAPELIGTRCRECGSVFFPREEISCRNPACGGGDLAEVRLGRRGRLWSYTTNAYPPPPPYVAADPFEPYAVAAVELAEEKMVVLGQVAHGVGFEQLEVGMEMELVLATLYEDEANQYLVWNWRPVASQGPGDGSR